LQKLTSHIAKIAFLSFRKNEMLKNTLLDKMIIFLYNYFIQKKGGED